MKGQSQTGETSASPGLLDSLPGHEDGLTVAMMTMVTGISTLVHLYSIGYMAGDKRFERFFAYLSLFTFSMLGIVIMATVRPSIMAPRYSQPASLPGSGIHGKFHKMVWG